MDIINLRLAKRYRAQKRFRFYGVSAVVLTLIFLSLLFVSLVGKGFSAFQQTFVSLDVFFDPEMLGLELDTAISDS